MKIVKSLIPFIIIWLIVQIPILILLYMSYMFGWVYIILIILIFNAALFIVNYIDISNDIGYINDDELIYNEQEGLFKTNKEYIKYTDIDFIRGNQNLLQKIINIGDIYIHTTKKAIIIENVKGYLEILQILQNKNF